MNYVSFIVGVLSKDISDLNMIHICICICLYKFLSTSAPIKSNSKKRSSNV